MNPSDSQCGPPRFRFALIRIGWCSSSATAPGLQHCTAPLPPHAPPATPKDSTNRFRSQSLRTTAFPIGPLGRHLQLINEATHRFTFVAACDFANWKLTTPLLPKGRFLELPGRTDNSPDGTLTRKTNSCYCERTSFNISITQLISNQRVCDVVWFKNR